MASLLLDEKICFIRLPLDRYTAKFLAGHYACVWSVCISCAGNVCHLLVVSLSIEGGVGQSFLFLSTTNNFLLPYVEM
jgi:hypothetical protein